MEQQKLLELIYTSRKTIIDMMIDRGVENKNGFLPFQHFLKTYQQMDVLDNNKNVLDLQFSNTQHHVYVKYIFSDKPNIKDTIENLQNLKLINENTKLIFVICYDKDIPPKILEQSSDKMQFFHISKLLFNVTKHKLVPRHQLLTNDEKNVLKIKLHLESLGQLPCIQKQDPICQYYGAQPGDVFKIYRNSKTSLEHITYRVCV